MLSFTEVTTHRSLGTHVWPDCQERQAVPKCRMAAAPGWDAPREGAPGVLSRHPPLHGLSPSEQGSGERISVPAGGCLSVRRAPVNQAAFAGCSECANDATGLPGPAGPWSPRGLGGNRPRHKKVLLPCQHSPGRVTTLGWDSLANPHVPFQSGNVMPADRNLSGTPQVQLALPPPATEVLETLTSAPRPNLARGTDPHATPRSLTSTPRAARPGAVLSPLWQDLSPADRSQRYL